MKDQLISFETAKLSRERGFNVAYESYNSAGEFVEFGMSGGYYDYSDSSFDGKVWAAPTQSLLQKWLREEHGIFVNIEVYNYESPGNFYFIPTIDFQRGNKNLYKGFENTFMEKQEVKCMSGEVKSTTDNNAYEEALEIGLQEGLKMIDAKE